MYFIALKRDNLLCVRRARSLVRKLNFDWKLKIRAFEDYVHLKVKRRASFEENYLHE